jgi:cytochrome c oxidase subunit 3
MAQRIDAEVQELAPPRRLRQFVADWAADGQAFRVSWSKAMMWIFLLSDTFIFGSFLAMYMAARMSTTATWPDISEIFALKIGHTEVPLILIAIMTFILISSSGTMVLAVNFAYRRERVKTTLFLMLTALLGFTFVGMQAFEWTKLILEGARPWQNPWGAPQFGAFFVLTGFHGLHVTGGVIILLVVALQALRGTLERTQNYQRVEVAGLYWHFVDLVWVFIFAFFYLW